jgi:hypothetical protein
MSSPTKNSDAVETSFRYGSKSDFRDRNDVSLRNLDQLTFEDRKNPRKKKAVWGEHLALAGFEVDMLFWLVVEKNILKNMSESQWEG